MRSIAILNAESDDRTESMVFRDSMMAHVQTCGEAVPCRLGFDESSFHVAPRYEG